MNRVAVGCGLMVLLLAAAELRAQLRVEEIPLGAKIGDIVRELDGTYDLIDSVESMYGWGTNYIVRLAGVPLAGLRGLLVLHVDSSEYVVSVHWTRFSPNRYVRNGALASYNGWNDWTVPDTNEFAKMTRVLSATLGTPESGDVIPVRLRVDNAPEPRVIRSAWNVDGSFRSLWLTSDGLEYSTRSFYSE
jgi:hypothetical protein